MQALASSLRGTDSIPSEMAKKHTQAALALLTDALERCRYEDVRSERLLKALDYLAAGQGDTWMYQQYTESLNDKNGEYRWQICNARMAFKLFDNMKVQKFVAKKQKIPNAKRWGNVMSSTSEPLFVLKFLFVFDNYSVG
jgi:hypothetical protein